MHWLAVKKCGFSSFLLGQTAWLENKTRGYRESGGIGGTKQGGDTEYWRVSHLKNF